MDTSNFSDDFMYGFEHGAEGIAAMCMVAEYAGESIAGNKIDAEVFIDRKWTPTN